MSNRYSWLPSATRAPHYGALLAVLLMLIVVAPLVPAERSGYAVEFLFDLVLLSGAYSAAWQSKHRFPLLALTLVTLVMRWTQVFSEHIGYSFGSISITLVWITYAIMLVVAALFRMRRVSTNAIFGAIVAYLLAAVAFAFAFELIELSHPGSFAGVPVGGTESELGNALLYFSFVCLTTMGYGDILPVSNLARPLAVLEGVFGTLYLAVMIARLVGLHIAAGASREGDGQ